MTACPHLINTHAIIPLPENRMVELPELLFTLTTEQIRDCINDQDNGYLVALSNKSLALEHYEVCAAIMDILQERISPVV